MFRKHNPSNDRAKQQPHQFRNQNRLLTNGTCQDLHQDSSNSVLQCPTYMWSLRKDILYSALILLPQASANGQHRRHDTELDIEPRGTQCSSYVLRLSLKSRKKKVLQRAYNPSSRFVPLEIHLEIRDTSFKICQ